MCYTGICKYEYKPSGDCPFTKDFPEDCYLATLGPPEQEPLEVPANKSLNPTSEPPISDGCSPAEKGLSEGHHTPSEAG